jgi:hypothetical protein
MALIAEDLLLLLLDDETGELHGASQLQVGLGGAVLSDLALDGRVEVEEKSSFWSSAKVRVVGTPPTDPVLADGYATVAEKERSAQDLVNRLGKGLKERLIDGLVARGVLREEKSKTLGFIPRTRWPAVDSTHEEEVRRALGAALLQGQPPEPHTAAIISILSALGEAHKVLDHEGMSNGDVKKRAKQIADGDWAAKGVSDAIAAANAAITAAIAASTAASTAAATSATN